MLLISDLLPYIYWFCSSLLASKEASSYPFISMIGIIDRQAADCVQGNGAAGFILARQTYDLRQYCMRTYFCDACLDNRSTFHIIVKDAFVVKLTWKEESCSH